jgi:hypothetical protein
MSTTERYAHLQHDPVRALADRTAGRIAAFGRDGQGDLVRMARPKAKRSAD